MTTAPALTLKLDAATGGYRPGERLSGHFIIESTTPWPVSSAELSILWYTAGQGEEDFAVHYFERFVDEPGRPLDLRLPRRFAAVLPPSPLSYDGRIVKVCWCARLRIFPQQGPEVVEEAAFRLGDVPPAPGDT
ncbi:MAG: hypothetical protein AB7G28_22990 [Pirellulales bacterium]